MSHPRPPFVFAGVTSPNTTQVPDQYLDELLPVLSGAELKVLLYITRRTFGFKKASDNIALSQMLNGIRTRDGRQLDAGVGLSKKTLLQALSSLEAMQIILRQRQSSAERGNEPTTYALNIAGSTLKSEKAGAPLAEKVHQGVGAKTPPSPRGKNYATQHTVKQHTDFNLSKSSNGENLAENEDERQQYPAQESPDFQHSPATTAKHDDEPPLKGLIARRAPKRRSDGDDRQAIGVIIEDFAAELGDSAPTRSSVTRAVNLFERSGASRDGFIDLLFQARAATRQMRSSPNHRPQKPMAYFFSVVEDQLGMKAVA